MRFRFGIFGATGDGVALDTAAPDLCPALVGEDVEVLEISSFRAAGSGAPGLLRLRDGATFTCTVAAR